MAFGTENANKDQKTLTKEQLERLLAVCLEQEAAIETILLIAKELEKINTPQKGVSREQ